MPLRTLVAPPAPAFEPLLVSVADASKILNQSPWSTYQDIANGVLDGRKAGRRTVITMESIKRKAAGLPKKDLPRPERDPHHRENNPIPHAVAHQRGRKSLAR
jgi:hypothetical protein